MAADNALGVLSEQHPDGWGVAFYVEGAPHVARSPSTAGTDKLFHRVSGVVSSETVLAHVRKATTGEVSVLNCHPFQYGRWTMAHNGDVRRIGEHRESLVGEIAPKLRRYVLGDTDSEVAFFVFLTRLARGRSLSDRFEAAEVITALDETVALLRDRCDQPDSKSTLTFIVTDGSVMAAHQGGKELNLSTYKGRCGDRDQCASLSPECEAPTKTGRVNHFILSSEPLEGENVWEPLHEGETIAVDWNMHLVRRGDGKTHLPIAASA
jgi:glutamine amidotransferase